MRPIRKRLIGRRERAVEEHGGCCGADDRQDEHGRPEGEGCCCGARGHERVQTEDHAERGAPT